jgi:hypothetical protein
MMNERRTTIMIAILLCCLLLVLALPEGLAAPTALSLERWVVAGGGGHAEVASYAMSGTIGQAVVGGTSNDPYQLGSGFWGGIAPAASAAYRIYLPLLMRN